jgi:hypothetical protein
VEGLEHAWKIRGLTKRLDSFGPDKAQQTLTTVQPNRASPTGPDRDWGQGQSGSTAAARSGQFGRASGPMIPQRVHTMRGPKVSRAALSLPARRKSGIPPQLTIFFSSIVCLLGEKFVAVSDMKYGLLGSDVLDSGCVPASVSGELSPMLAPAHDSPHPGPLQRQYHGAFRSELTGTQLIRRENSGPIRPDPRHCDDPAGRWANP